MTKFAAVVAVPQWRKLRATGGGTATAAASLSQQGQGGYRFQHRSRGSVAYLDYGFSGFAFFFKSPQIVNIAVEVDVGESAPLGG